MRRGRRITGCALMLGLWGKAPLASAQAPLPCPVGSAIEAERERGRVARGALRDEEEHGVGSDVDRGDSHAPSA
jgi:hypothetical protein